MSTKLPDGIEISFARDIRFCAPQWPFFLKHNDSPFLTEFLLAAQIVNKFTRRRNAF